MLVFCSPAGGWGEAERGKGCPGGWGRAEAQAIPRLHLEPGGERFPSRQRSHHRLHLGCRAHVSACRQTRGPPVHVLTHTIPFFGLMNSKGLIWGITDLAWANGPGPWCQEVYTDVCVSPFKRVHLLV